MKTLVSKAFRILFLSHCLVFALLGQNSRTGHTSQITLKATEASAEQVLYYLANTYGVLFSFEQSVLDRRTESVAIGEIDEGDALEGTISDGTMKSVDQTSYDFLELKRHKIDLDLKGASLETTLSKLIEQLENYDWKFSDGVVNIFPIKGRDSRVAGLLNLKVAKYSFSKERSGRSLTMSIMGLKEVQKYLKDNNLSYSGRRLGPDSGKVPLNIEFDFRDISVGEILNKLSAATKRFWIIKWDGTENGVDKLFIQN